MDWKSFSERKSYSRTYGARNLRRTIQKELEDPMATKIINSYEEPIIGQGFQREKSSSLSFLVSSAAGRGGTRFKGS